MTNDIEIIDRYGRKRRARKGETLQDGERFSMQFMDAAARELRDHLAAKYGPRVVVDGSGAAAGHKPGFLYDSANTKLQDEATLAYEARNARMRDAWRKKRPDDEEDDDEETAWQQRQRLARKAAHENSTDAQQPTLDELRAAVDQAYADRNVRLANAWKTRVA